MTSSSTLRERSAFLYGGIFFISTGVIMMEFTLTRILSVTMWYHFAYLVVSLAFFGISVGGIITFFQYKYRKDFLYLGSVGFSFFSIGVI